MAGLRLRHSVGVGGKPRKGVVMARTKSEFLSAWGLAGEIFKVIVDAVLAAGGNDTHLLSLRGDQKRLAAIAAIIVGSGEQTDMTITIPADATAEQLIADAKAAFEQAGIPFTYFNENAITLIERDLELVKSKTLEVLTHRFDRYWTTREGRDLQKGKGFDGNAAAFLVWVAQAKPKGWFVSIANTDDRLFPGGGYLCAPCFVRVGSGREFDLGDVRDEWLDGGLLVAFRAI